MAVSEKARKVRKPPQPRKKASKVPLYIFIIVVIVVFTLIGIGIYFSLGQVSANIIFAVAIIIAMSIILEFLLKRPVYRREMPEDEKEEDSAKSEEKEITKAVSTKIERDEP